jgi:hypothetical protein
MNGWLLEERGILGKCLPLTVHRLFGDMNVMYWIGLLCTLVGIAKRRYL